MLIASGETGIYWAIDQTNWQIGHNYKVIGICLDKKGNSNELERIGLINDFIKLFFPHIPKHLGGAKHIILGHREFIGKQ